jgi:hypothetical protein
MRDCTDELDGTDTTTLSTNSRNGRTKSKPAAHVEAWIYFDNDREGFAIKNAQELIRLLRGRGLKVA